MELFTIDKLAEMFRLAETESQFMGAIYFNSELERNDFAQILCMEISFDNWPRVFSISNIEYVSPESIRVNFPSRGQIYLTKRLPEGVGVMFAISEPSGHTVYQKPNMELYIPNLTELYLSTTSVNSDDTEDSALDEFLDQFRGGEHE